MKTLTENVDQFSIIKYNPVMKYSMYTFTYKRWTFTYIH